MGSNSSRPEGRNCKKSEKRMELGSGGEIGRLPEVLLPAVISPTTPRDACRCAAVSAAFRSVADSDDVWSRFLPRDLPPLAAGELDPPPPSKKDLFFRLCDRPVLLADGRTSLVLERESAAKYYMLSAKKLTFIWAPSDHGRYEPWRYIPRSDSRFSEGAELVGACRLDINGWIESQMLSPNTTYAVYLVFKIAVRSKGLDEPPQEATISVGGNEWMQKVRLQHKKKHKKIEDGDDGENIMSAHLRNDGWMEVQMGEFYNEDGANGLVRIGLMETEGGKKKRGLIVQGIEIRTLKEAGITLP